MDLASFLADEKTVDAVLFCYGVIGEAARHVPDDIVAANPHLPWSEMRAMRNVIVHECFGVTHETLLEDSARGPPGPHRAAAAAAGRTLIAVPPIPANNT
jgi:uncharacterized protein with HEPN domain